ncbi:hypothetical protein K505DRAFT_325141 [Melanomma pulvis-pyrius CBS 109.77]|uniref:Nuclear speckle splicing regulatory protein 1 N-terminal domain-containing protein n=1 Tax=Melanomma pulvis-pyrius CBS 109.77 TaxID=1314802 RepID=A0A6A6XD09_9PLEO|nr:hypothetical protein K505DRAFT_325141 [Melanomma pulvis-pyrius CBS 109.77]
MSFKFGLKVKNLGGRDPKKPAPGKRKPIFEDEGDDDGEDRAKVTDGGVEIAEFNFDDTLASTSTSSKPSNPTPPSKLKAPPSGPPTRKPIPKRDDPTTFVNLASIQEAEKRAQEAIQVDSSIYDYDAAYDALHAKSAIKAAVEREDALQRRPKYMNNLIESTELRKKDLLRAKDKLLQREREAEGDEFKDKDKFVTGAYKLQQEEARKAEEEEKKKQEIEEANRRKSGMQGFHRQMLIQEEQRHQEAIKAAALAAKEGVKLVVEESEEKSTADIAKKLINEGKNIIVNEDGQVADKRQLLSAGLNIVAKPKSATAASTTSTHSSGPQPGPQGRTAAQRAVRERQTQMVVDQIAQVTKRAADEEAEEQRKLEHASKSRKTEGDISSAKERYLQRKREAAAAKAKAAAGS